jgi:hypothetical protein
LPHGLRDGGFLLVHACAREFGAVYPIDTMFGMLAC